MNIHAHMNACTHMHAHTHTYTHTHMNTHVPKQTRTHAHNRISLPRCIYCTINYLDKIACLTLSLVELNLSGVTAVLFIQPMFKCQTQDIVPEPRPGQ